MASVLDEPLLLGLAERYGPLVVWEYGLELFGRPPTWEPSLMDVLRLTEFLKERVGGK